jgi:hypothetical protein
MTPRSGRHRAYQQRRAGVAAAAVLVAGTGLLAGCASTGSQDTAAPSAAATAPLASAMTVAGGATWAIVGMGAAAADQNNFWELFTRPAGSTRWALATPPGVADNGGLVASGSGGSLTVAVRPSQALTFSPLATTSNDGKTWGTGLLDAPVAAVPDALAADGANMLALLGNGSVDQADGSGASWTPLAAPGAVAASAAGRRCQVTALTAVAYSPSGTPLAATSCASAGIVGIFARTAGTWRAAGPAAPGDSPVRVLRLAATTAGDTALLASGTGGAASLRAAWTPDGTHWTTSPSLPAGSGQVRALGTGPGTTVWALLSGGRAATVAGPGAAWRQLPAPPPATAALAAGPGGTTDALAVTGASLTVYRLTPAGTWSKAQAVTVPIQYGSSS